jgi:hypothetical protein
VVVPNLKLGLKSQVESTRKGVCVGLTEILNCCTEKQATEFSDVLVSALQQALCDDAPTVSAVGAKAFITFYKLVGSTAVDAVVPALLSKLAQGDEVQAELALNGLKQIVSLRPGALFEYLLPSLMASPIQYVSARALGSIAEVCGTQLNFHFQTIVPTLVLELYTTSDKIDKLQSRVKELTEKVEAQVEGGGDGEEGDLEELEDITGELDFETERFVTVKEAAATIMGAVTTQGVHYFISEVGKQVDHETSHRRRTWGVWMLEQFFRRSKAEFNEYVSIFLKYVLSRVAESYVPLLEATSACLQAMSTCVPLEELLKHISFIRSCISSTASTARHATGPASTRMFSATGEFILPLFTLPKSLDPLLAIFLFGLMNGQAFEKENCAEGIAEVAKMAEIAVLKPVLIKATGPLIRVIGDRSPSNVKSAILQALLVLMERGGVSLKAFVPQLQSTFIKSLQDPARDVRQKGACALGRLMALGPKIDLLLSELAGICVQADSNAIKTSVMEAIASVLLEGGGKATPAVLGKVRAAVITSVLSDDDAVRGVVGKCLSALATHLDPAEVTDMLMDLVDGAKWSQDSNQRAAGRLIGCASLLQGAGDTVEQDLREETFELIRHGIQSVQMTVKAAACTSLGIIFAYAPVGALSTAVGDGNAPKATARAAIRAFIPALCDAAVEEESSEVRVEALSAIKYAARNYYVATSQHMKLLLPPIVHQLKGIDIRVKYSAERALKALSEGQSLSKDKEGGAVAPVDPSMAFLNPTFATYLVSPSSGGEATTKQYARDYVKRITSRQAADSDDER